ncbi:MAG: FAD-linked oxidase C-terminal domain-containing protein [Bacteroidales bacterium]
MTDSVFQELENQLDGNVYTDKKMRLLYATDASAYREVPVAVALPRHKEDIQRIIAFANLHKIPLIPRTAGTSLAGQVVGSGIIVDVSKYMTRILELNEQERWVRVEPGVILDELNLFLAPHGLFFGPETSTANRCMIGGMAGNNACGSHSLIYGSTRDHTLSVTTLLSDGSEAIFGPVSSEKIEQKKQGQTLEGKIYQHIDTLLRDEDTRNHILEHYPNPAITRRNTGYALDLLAASAPYTPKGPTFNLANLLCGSEGTLAFTTEIKLNLIPAPPKEVAIVAVHLKEKQEAFRANLVALKHNPGAVEMMDHIVLDLTKDNHEQQKNRFFIEGRPGAILLVEFARNTRAEIQQCYEALTHDLSLAGYGYAYPIVYGAETKKVWALRKAGLGVLSNLKGDARPVSLIEDTAVTVEDLPEYMNDFQKILDNYNLSCVFHAHIGTGELHLRPILNLKEKRDVELFRTLAYEIAHLVKKYRGSMSGEHGDGRVRGELIPIILGDENYRHLKALKQVWDPNGLFNPGKIVDAPDMRTSLRYEPGRAERQIETFFDFSSVGGILRAAEKCNGSGDCRKTEIIGGTMCPSYMATRNEKDGTRARANILREFLTHSTKKNPFDHPEIKEVMDLCLSCKACKSECPSSVDVAKLKAEFLQHYYQAHGIPLRTRLIANITGINKLGSLMPGIFNFFMQNAFVAPLFMRIFGFAPQRRMPTLASKPFRRHVAAYKQALQPKSPKIGTVFYFVDEFTNYNDTDIGVATVQLLTRLGYNVIIPDTVQSGRSFLSKGMLKRARKLAEENVSRLSEKITAETPLIGTEPSAILSFRDEYPELVKASMRAQSRKLAQHCFMLEEFLMREIEAGNIRREQFTCETKNILLHGHCQQKAVASTEQSLFLLNFPANYYAKEIPSGCCGMAGSFGYEKEHYEISQKIGEMVLFPTVRKANEDTLIAAPGTSCRHQIKEGTQRTALHPAEILYAALK